MLQRTVSSGIYSGNDGQIPFYRYTFDLTPPNNLSYLVWAMSDGFMAESAHWFTETITESSRYVSAGGSPGSSIVYGEYQMVPLMDPKAACLLNCVKKTASNIIIAVQRSIDPLYCSAVATPGLDYMSEVNARKFETLPDGTIRYTFTNRENAGVPVFVVKLTYPMAMNGVRKREAEYLQHRMQPSA